MRVRASGSFRRYAVDPRAIEGGARKLRDDGGALEKRLHSNRFQSIDQAGSEVASAGWCRGDGTVPRQFVAEDHWLGPVLAAALRIDRKKLPAGALRVRRMEAEAAERRSVGERIAPARRRELADKIESELVGRCVPSTALHTMLWSVERGELLLQTTAESSNASFRALFAETFGSPPEPLTTASLALRRVEGRGGSGARGATKFERSLDELVPALFVEHGVALVEESASFLGREFLLWLWHGVESAGGKFELPELDEVGVAFDTLLELGGATSEGGGRITLRGDAPTRTNEAASALLAGRLPIAARVVVSREERSFDVTLAADTLDLANVKVTAESEDVADENLRAHDEQRARWLFELAAIVDGLFARFLELRLSRGFERDVVPAMRDWVVSRARPRSRTASAAR
jgi:hypothetical protein